MITVILSRMSQCFTVFFPKQTGAAGSSQGEPYDETLPPDNPLYRRLFHSLLWIFRYYPQLKTSFLGICILCYAAAYFIRWCLEPQYALFLLRRRTYYLSESDAYLFFTLYGLEDEDGNLTQARDLAVLSWIQRCKKQIPDDSPVLRIIQNRTFKDPEEEKYIPISLYELILRQLAFQNPDILNGLKYYNRQCDK